jgi:hypothetical protein
LITGRLIKLTLDLNLQKTIPGLSKKYKLSRYVDVFLIAVSIGLLVNQLQLKSGWIFLFLIPALGIPILYYLEVFRKITEIKK